MANRIIQPVLPTAVAKQQGILVRDLLVGFYHGLGLEDYYHGGLDESEYYLKWSGPVSGRAS